MYLQRIVLYDARDSTVSPINRYVEILTLNVTEFGDKPMKR